jgi:hypothetical protein
MVSSSKILTVSYGTFSCTLEGFDDSFDTMKAIAEYFRDLAADDRYFGAEPPTPDADMLARIAEREIARRVDASEQEGKIVLRAAEDTALNAPAEEPEAQEQQEQDDQPAEQAAPALKDEAESTAPTAEAAAEQTDEFAETPHVEPEAAQADVEPEIADTPVAEPAAEKASDSAISAAMSAFDSDESAQPVTDAELAEPEAEAAAVPVTEEAPEEALDEPITEPEAEADDIADESEPTDFEAAQVADTTTAAEVDQEGDSVADRLRRIRSLVDESDAGFQDSVYSEDEHAQDFLSETAADLDEALRADDAMETAAQDETAEPDLSSILGAAEEDSHDQDDEPEPVESIDVPQDSSADKVEEAAPEIAEDTLAQLLADAMPEEDTDSEPAPAPEEANAEEDAEERPAVHARVVKMKRSEFEAAISEGYLQEDETDSDVDDNLFGDDSGLSAEEEADLQRELAEVEAEFTQPDQDLAEDLDAPLKLTEADQVQETAKDEAFEAPEQEAAAHGDIKSENLDAEAEEDKTPRGISKLQRAERQADLARIFDEADTQLDEPESNQRRNAIQHLRAAVAATRAEKKAGASLKQDVDESPYRDDLANVVRPRRPEAGEGRPRSSRPSVTPSSPAPLKLVAEQRVDVESAPVRPRRISKASMAEAETLAPTPDVDGNFTDFAEEMGAKGLPELLEAAAAYMSDVEGRSQFSRPMLMGKLKEVEGREFSREDGLRSFGQLLRQGKLQKLKGGRFCVSDSTDFRAEERNAG